MFSERECVFTCQNVFLSYNYSHQKVCTVSEPFPYLLCIPMLLKHLHFIVKRNPCSYALDELPEYAFVVYHIWQILRQFLSDSVYFIAIPGPREQLAASVDLRGAQSAAVRTASVSAQRWGYRTSSPSIAMVFSKNLTIDTLYEGELRVVICQPAMCSICYMSQAVSTL